tara:strand:+ start:1203 stop:2006 length:804 start_codon:yes stop_codon:yes gene_type:complete
MNAVAKYSGPAMVLRPQNFGELVQFANMAAKSSMVPAQYKGQPESIMLAIQMGSELGLAPMQALQNIAVVNGRPSVWGDAVVGLCRQSPVCRDVVETVDGEGDKMIATCTAIRVGAEPVVRTFSVDDAKKAGLWGKAGPWQQYPRRMLQMRARGFALRDAFPDVLRGLITTEEAADMPPDKFTGQTIEAAPAAPCPPKPTINDWLNELEAELANATTAEEVDAILARDKVQSAQDKLTGTAKERMAEMCMAAIERTGEPGVDAEGRE